MNELVPILGGFSLVALAAFAIKKSANSVTNKLNLVDVVDILPKHPYKKYQTRSLEQIKNLVIHHSAGDHQSPEQIARFHSTSDHLQQGGAPGIAYHFYITEDGTIYKTNQLQTVSWHVSNNNTASIGICLSGNLNHHPPTKAQQKKCGDDCSRD